MADTTSGSDWTRTVAARDERLARESNERHIARVRKAMDTYAAEVGPNFVAPEPEPPLPDLPPLTGFETKQELAERWEQEDRLADARYQAKLRGLMNQYAAGTQAPDLLG